MTNEQLLTIIVSLGGLILTGGGALASLILVQSRAIRRDMTQMESRFGDRMDRMESRLREDLERLDGRVARLEHSQAKLEGLLEGLREAITRQPAA